jgi:hypothetical protein
MVATTAAVLGVLQGYDISGAVLYVPHFPIHRDPDLW